MPSSRAFPLAREIAAGRGAVLSEFLLDAPPLPHHFPRRKRLLAALSALELRGAVRLGGDGRYARSG